VAGLKGHIQREALQGSLAVAILNLKPARLAGEASEAMLLAADAPREGGGELVRLLIPPGTTPFPSL
jgi:aminoacyl tRNA synthase complex-interacting multifunctional protein 1